MSGKKKLLHIIPSLSIGGAEKLIFNSICLFPEYEHHVISFSADPAFLAAFQQLAKVHMKRSSDIFTPSNLLYLRQIENQVQPDIIHSHLLKTNWLSRFAFIANRNLVNSIHSLYSVDAFRYHSYTKWLERHSYRLSKAVLIFVSELVKNDYARNISLYRENFVVQNFVPDEYFKINPLVYEPLTSLKLIAVGNLKKLKNYRLMIEVFKLLKEYPISLDIYGDGDLTEEYKAEILDHNLKIHLKGKVDSVASILPYYHAFIFPSLYEGFSISLLEAMSAGLPLLLSRISAFENVVKGNAYYFDPNDIVACQAAILCMFKNGFPPIWAINNKSMAEENFSAAVYKNKMYAIYNSIIFTDK
jgi:glycosyltransferase involved in cell wall biosynthesis